MRMLKRKNLWMMSRFRTLYVAVLVMCAVFLSACETVIEIDPPDYDPELYIVSKFSPDSSWVAQLTSTIPLSVHPDSVDIFVHNATVMIYDGDLLVDRLVPRADSSFWYVSSLNHTPASETLYRIVVEAPGFTSISATSMAPPPPVLLDVDIEEFDDIEDPFNTEEYRIKFSIENPSGLHYFGFSTFQGSYVDSTLGWESFSLSTMYIRHDSRRWYCYYEDVLNPIGVEVSDGSEYCSIGLLSNRSFQDQSRIDFELTTNYFENFLGDQEQPSQDSRFVLLVVQSLSPEYIEYHSSLESQLDFEGFEEPVNLYSNVEGGRGVFAGSSVSYRVFDLSEME